MNKQKVASELVDIVKMLIGGSSRIAYRLIENPAKLVKEMKKHGLALDRNGIWVTYGFTPIGVPDLSKPIYKSKDISKVINQTFHILKSLGSKISDHERLLDMVTKVRQVYEREGEEAALDLIDSFNKSPYVLKSVRRNSDENRVKIKALVDQLSEEVMLEANSRKVNSTIDDLQDVIEKAIDRWENQVKPMKERRKFVKSLAKKLQEDPEMFVEIVEEAWA